MCAYIFYYTVQIVSCYPLCSTLSILLYISLKLETNELDHCQVESALPVLCGLIHENDDEDVVSEACWAFSHLSDELDHCQIESALPKTCWASAVCCSALSSINYPLIAFIINASTFCVSFIFCNNHGWLHDVPVLHFLFLLLNNLEWLNFIVGVIHKMKLLYLCFGL